MNLEFACRCGRLRGELQRTEELRGRSFICLCDDCQTYAHWLGLPRDLLDENGGTRVVPVFPARLKILGGHQNLRCMMMMEGGLYRWYAGCCRAAIANSMSGGFGYIGFIASRLRSDERDIALGPVAARIMGKYGLPPLPAKTHPKIPIGLVLRTVVNVFWMTLKDLKRPSPFFSSQTGQPVSPPEILTMAERNEARGRAGFGTTSENA